MIFLSFTFANVFERESYSLNSSYYEKVILIGRAGFPVRLERKRPGGAGRDGGKICLLYMKRKY